MRKRVVTFYQFNKQVVLEYLADNVIKYSASLAYYTTLSLAPMLVLIISVSGILFGKEAMSGEVYKQMHGLIGVDAAVQIQSMIKSIHLSKDTPVATMISFVILLIGATGIFGEMQDSLNKIWGLKTTSRKVWWQLILTRLLSFTIIICMGFVLMVSLILNAVVAAISGKLNLLIHGAGDRLIPIVDTLLSVGISMLLFATIFKILPDAKIKWKDVFIGALITSVLFTLGKLGIGYYLIKSNLATVFGAAGSVIIIMIWVYYSSAILYLGAVFTKVYATNFGGKITPNDYAMWIKVEEIPVPEVTLNPEVTMDEELNVNNNNNK